VPCGKAGTERPEWDVESLIPHCREKPLSVDARATVPQTDTGRWVEDTKAIERTSVKELGKLTPYLRKKGCPVLCCGMPTGAVGGCNNQAQATVYQKHRSLLNAQADV
jgi:hypothetical protein